MAILQRLGPEAPLVALPLSSRIKCALAALGVEVLRDAAEVSARSLLLRASFGHKSLRQLQAALELHGLSLRDADLDLDRLDAATGGAEDDSGDLQTELEGLLRIAGVADHERRRSSRTLGFDGGGVSPAGKDGASGETAAQLRSRVAARLATASPETPVLRRAIAAVADMSPCTCDAAARRLHELGLSTAPFAIEGLVTASELVGIVPRFVVEDSLPRIVTTPYRANVVAEVLVGIQRAHLERSIVKVEEVVAEAAPSGGRDRWFDIVVAVVDARSDLEWVDRAHRLFARTGVLDGVAERIRKILAAASQVTVSEVLDALLRDRQAGGIELPRAAIARVCETMTGVELQGDVLTRVTPADTSVLSEAERIALEVYRARGSILEAADLQRHLEAAGVDAYAAQAVVQSPMLARVGRGRYALRGWGFDLTGSDEGTGAKRPEPPAPAHATWSSSVAALEHDARHAALLQVFRERPETTLEELLAASRALGTTTVVELARAALGAGVVTDDDRAKPPPPDARPGPRAPTPPLATAEEPSRAKKKRGRLDAAERERYVQRIVAALRRAAEAGLRLEDLRPDVGGSQAQLRRVLRQLEDDGQVVRFGSTRWTTYRLASLRAKPGPSSSRESTAPVIRARRDRIDPNDVDD